MSNVTILNFQKSTLSKNRIVEKYKRSALSLSIAGLTGIEPSLPCFYFLILKKKIFCRSRRLNVFGQEKGRAGDFFGQLCVQLPVKRF